MIRLAGTPGPGTRARLIARASTVSGETAPAGPGLTENQKRDDRRGGHLEAHAPGDRALQVVVGEIRADGGLAGRVGDPVGLAGGNLLPGRIGNPPEPGHVEAVHRVEGAGTHRARATTSPDQSAGVTVASLRRQEAAHQRRGLLGALE